MEKNWSEEGRNDGFYGRTSSNSFKSSQDYENYQRGYRSGESNRVAIEQYFNDAKLGETLVLIGEFLKHALMYRLPILWPSYLVLYLVVSTGIAGDSLQEFVDNFKINGLKFLGVLLFVFIPTIIITNNFYLYIRGVDFAHVLINKNQKRLFNGLALYTIFFSCFLFTLWAYIAIMKLAGGFHWLILAFIIYVIYIVVKDVTIFHWDHGKSISWMKNSRYFKKGVIQTIAKNNFTGEINLEYINSKDEFFIQRNKQILNIRHVSFVVILLSVLGGEYVLGRYNNYKEQQRIAEFEKYMNFKGNRKVFSNLRIRVYSSSTPEKGNDKDALAILDPYVCADSILNIIKNTAKENNFSYLPMKEHIHWFNINPDLKSIPDGGWIDLDRLQVREVEAKLFEKKRPKNPNEI